MSAPVIQTARLTLRGHVMADFAPLADLLGSDRAQYMGGPYTRKDAWALFAAEVGAWDLLGHGSWTIGTRDGQFLGQVGINHPVHFPERELGWTLLSGAEGQGYAFEAASAALSWAWAQGWETLVSYVDPANARSRALAERLGAVLDPEAARPEGESPEDTLVYRHFADTDGSPEAYA